MIHALENVRLLCKTAKTANTPHDANPKVLLSKPNHSSQERPKTTTSLHNDCPIRSLWLSRLGASKRAHQTMKRPRSVTSTLHFPRISINLVGSGRTRRPNTIAADKDLLTVYRVLTVVGPGPRRLEPNQRDLCPPSLPRGVTTLAWTNRSVALCYVGLI
ncbi:hypothetical protein J6590_014075 [Homalodisca vitripennis]|nr:hypothetical protein J6590_014075 [Homalodisca vitripennis]